MNSLRNHTRQLIGLLLIAAALTNWAASPAHSGNRPTHRRAALTGGGSLTTPAAAEPSTVLLEDNFDIENGGSGTLNFFGFTNWDVTAGSVDLIGNGFSDFLPGNGLYVDLDGTTSAAGTLESKKTFTLIPATYRLEFSLAGSQLGGFNPVIVRLGDVYEETFVPDNNAPFTTITRDITVSTQTTAKIVFQHLGSDNIGTLLDNVRLLTDITETHLFDISPDHGGNAGRVTASLGGINFPAGPVAVKLVAQGQPDIVTLSAAVASHTQIVATFDLAGANTGPRDVVVTLSDGPALTLGGAFTVEEGGAAQVWADIIGRDAIRPGREQTLTVVYGNRGNVDVEDEHFVVLSCPADGILTVDRAIAAYGEPPYPPVVEGSEQAVAIFVPRLAAQNSSSFNVRFTTSGNAPVVIRAAIVSIRDVETTPATAQQARARTALAGTVAAAGDDAPPVGATVYLGPHGGNPFGHQAMVGLHPETNQVVVWDHFLGPAPRPLDEWLQAWGDAPYLGWATPPGWTPAIGEEAARAAAELVSGGAIPDATHGKNVFGQNRYSCAGLCELAYEQAGLNPNPLGLDLLLLPGTNYRRDTGKFDFYKFNADLNANVSHLTFGLRQISDSVGGFLSLFGMAQASAEKLMRVVAAFDPNEKTGSLGAGGQHYLSGEEPLRYAIFFENVATATAPAQEVVVTDQLDTANLDLSTFAFGPITFGNRQLIPPPNSSEFAADVDLRPGNNLLVKVDARLDKTTGLATWKFTSLDPATGIPTDDPLAGFLPPNTNPPDGEGHVFFTVTPKRVLPTGTEIRNQASIVFDTNAAILTPTWLNTLDNSAPASHVHALSAAGCSTNLNVQWSGTDEGSGVRDYTIYVSEDGGPFNVWQSDTTATSGTYAGQPGHTYAFYSVARDMTGNVEDAPPEADLALMAADTNAPVIVGAAVDKPSLSPPNHKMVDVRVSYQATDNCDAPSVVACALSVSSNEPVNGTGDGDTAPDWEILDAHRIRLRAERSGGGKGRVYTVTITCTDRSGNSSKRALSVSVPKNQK
jgi:hypothetical protein